MDTHHLGIVPMEVIHLLFHHIEELVHSYLVFGMVFVFDDIVSQILKAYLVDTLLGSLVLECGVDARPIYIKKVKGVLLVKVGSPFLLKF